MQLEFFDSGQPRKKELAIVKHEKKELSKKQKDFNKLVRKLEKLQNERDLLTVKLDEGLKYYAGHIQPLEQQLVTLRTTCVKVLYSFYKEKTLLSSSNKKILAQIIEASLAEIFELSAQEPDDEIKLIMEKMSGQSYDEMKKERFEETFWEVKEMFEDLGLDINLDGIDENTSEEDLARKMKQLEEELRRQADEMEQKNATRKKTKKQLEREAKELKLEEARKKNIGTIYKQLAKTFHPDLETDSASKLQKEELMKELTVAYEKNDLHTLLKLEMEWLKKEEGDIEELSDEKLGLYNEVLREQVQEAEMAIDMLVSNPRYRHLQRFADEPSQLSIKVLEKEKLHLHTMVSSLEIDEANLKGKDALKCVKGIIKAVKEQPVVYDPDVDELIVDFLRRMK